MISREYRDDFLTTGSVGERLSTISFQNDAARRSAMARYLRDDVMPKLEAAQ